MIKLYSYGENFSVIDPSPFVLKVDAYLRMANIEYETIATLGNLKSPPRVNYFSLMITVSSSAINN